jgi:hypothetical protein
MKNLIMTTAIVMFATAGSLVSADAQETPNTTVEQIEEIDETVSVAEYISSVCSNANVILSERAIDACNDDIDAMPTMLNDGTRLSNRGVGAEFNVLIRNIAFFQQN